MCKKYESYHLSVGLAARYVLSQLQSLTLQCYGILLLLFLSDLHSFFLDGVQILQFVPGGLDKLIFLF